MIHPPAASFSAAMAARRSPWRDTPAAPVRILTWALTWALAALVVTGAHLGIYAILVQDPATDAQQPPANPAAVMIGLVPAPTVARSEADNQAEGPASTVRDEAAPAEERPSPPEATLAALPAPPEPEPEAVLAPAPPKAEPQRPEIRKPERPAPQVKPHRKVEPVRTPKTRREDRTDSARNGGGPHADQRTADRTAAPTAGDTGSVEAHAAWESAVRSRIVRNKRFPVAAHGITGVALVRVTFTASGGASNIRLVASSGNAALDAEAEAVMSRAAPYPPPPGGLAIALTVPLNFRR